MQVKPGRWKTRNENEVVVLGRMPGSYPPFPWLGWAIWNDKPTRMSWADDGNWRWLGPSPWDLIEWIGEYVPDDAVAPNCPESPDSWRVQNSESCTA